MGQRTPTLENFIPQRQTGSLDEVSDLLQNPFIRAAQNLQLSESSTERTGDRDNLHERGSFGLERPKKLALPVT
jgi:hypothetical protein